MRCYVGISLLLLFLGSGQAMALDKLILIGKDNPINNSDQILMGHLTALGLNVEYHSEPEKHPVDIKGAVGVFISESVTSGNIGPAYDLPIPVIMSEPGLIDDLKMGIGQDVANATSIAIVQQNHPITKGYQGVVKVLSQPETLASASALEGDAQILAVLAGDAGIKLLFVYEAGAQMQTEKAPARRAFVFNEQSSTPFVTDDGWTLIERAVTWVLATAAPVSNQGTLTTTWGAIKSD